MTGYTDLIVEVGCIRIPVYLSWLKFQYINFWSYDLRTTGYPMAVTEDTLMDAYRRLKLLARLNGCTSTGTKRHVRWTGTDDGPGYVKATDDEYMKAMGIGTWMPLGSYEH